MIKISQSVKLPLRSCKGNSDKRLHLAKKLNSDFFERINKEFVTKDITKETIAKRLQEITPNINFIITQNNPRRNGAVIPMLSPQNHKAVNHFSLELPLNKFDKTLSLLSGDVLFHESLHYFLNITNPKHLARSAKNFETGVQEKTEKFYKERLYKQSAHFDKNLQESEIKEFLNTLADTEKIDFLQSSRYRLTQELHAYKDGSKYSKRIQDIHEDLICEKITPDDGQFFYFSEKIKIIEDELKRVLKKCRKELKDMFMIQS